MPGALGLVVAATINRGWIRRHGMGNDRISSTVEMPRRASGAVYHEKYTQGSDNAQWEKRATEADESVQPKQCPKIVEHNLSSINRSVEIIVVRLCLSTIAELQFEGSAGDENCGRRSKTVVVSVQSRSSD